MGNEVYHIWKREVHIREIMGPYAVVFHAVINEETVDAYTTKTIAKHIVMMVFQSTVVHCQYFKNKRNNRP